MISPRQHALKRAFDIVFAVIVLVLALPVIVLAVIAASVDTRQFGLFTQARVGRHGQLFRVCKIRTMRGRSESTTNVTTADDARLTPLGKLLRNTKIDELPQFFNVLIGNMSVVGPRPDVPGYADQLAGQDRVILGLRPGVTGPASIRYRDEESLLATVAEPERYNRDVIYPDKVRINREYIEQWSFRGDLVYIWRTLVG